MTKFGPNEIQNLVDSTGQVHLGNVGSGKPQIHRLISFFIISDP